MQTEALAAAAARDNAPDFASFGPVTLQVTSLSESVAFYERALGLVAEPTPEGVAMRAGGRELLLLQGGATTPAQVGHRGLYHVAIGVPSQGEFSRLLARLVDQRVHIALVDHLMSKAIYLSDPDGIGIEIAFETPERFGRFGPSGRRFELYDRDGRWHSGRAPLDLRRELMAMSGEIEDPLAAGSGIAHLHFSVADLHAALSFYRRIGFLPNLVLPSMGFADLGSGGAYTHRIALNTWQGEGIGKAPPHSARLLGYTIFMHGTPPVRPTMNSAAPATLIDPVGATLHLAFRADKGSSAS